MLILATTIIIWMKFNGGIMKKIIIPIIAVTAFAAALGSCQKQEIVVPDTQQEVTLTFSSEKPSFDDDTKTEWTGETIQWSAGDKIAVAYTVDGNWQNASGNASGDAKLYKSTALEAAAETAKFNVSTDFTGETEGTHVFYGVYPAPSATSFPDAPVATLTIPAIQTPTASSFDGSADLMTAVSGEYSAIPDDRHVSLRWTRLVAHANITLKALNGVTEGETVSSIELTAQGGANLVGSQKVNIITNEVTNNNNESNILELNGGNLTIAEGGNIEFWACILPETLTSLTVVVETNKATYTRVIESCNLVFMQNARNILPINMSTAVREAKEEVSWVLVTPDESLTEGTYVLVASTNTKTGALVSTNGSSSAPTFNTSVSVSDNTLNGVTEAMQFDLSGTTGNYILAVTGQTTNYLYTTSSNNGVRVGTNANNVWTIDKHESNSNAFVFKCNATSRYLGVYNNTDWRCYTAFDVTNFTNGNGSSQIYLYKKQSGSVVPDTTPRISVPSKSIEVEADATSAEFTYTLKNVEGTPSIEVAEDATMAVVSTAVNEGTVTVLFNENTETVEKSATLVLSIDGAENVEVVITQKAWVDTSVIEELTVAEFMDKDVNTDVWYKLTGKVSNIVNTTYGNFDLVDETGTVLVYGLTATKVTSNDNSFASLNLKAGDVLTLIGTRADYNGTAQVGGPAYYVSHLVSCAAPQIACSDNTVTITAEDGATIYYTTNGDDPTTSSETYTSPFDITETITVKAIAVAAEKPQSSVAEAVCQYVAPGDAPLITVNVTFSEYAAGTQYAENEEHRINNDLTIYTTQCHFTSELRIYSSETHNGYVVSNMLPGSISTMSFNAGYKTDVLNVYGSDDGSTWTLVKELNTTTSYEDYIVDFESTTYKYFKLDVEGTNQIRLKSMSVTYKSEN